MNAHTAKEEMGLLTTGFSQVSTFHREPARPGILARAALWLRQQRDRRAVLEELAQLNDRELADIGLARSDVPHVFDRSFAAMREEQRDTTGRAFGAYNFG